MSIPLHNGTSQRNHTADRAINMLLLFSEVERVITAADIAVRLQMSKSTTYRYLQTLKASGFLEEVPGGAGFQLGPRIVQLARLARTGTDVSVVALPVMRELAAATQEVVLLTRRMGNQVLCLERIESSHPIRLSYERGQTLPLHAGASAKVLLAFERPEEIELALDGLVLERYTDATVTDLVEFRRQLDEIRAAGYVVSEGEIDPGVIGVGAPIFRRDGTIACGLSVAAPRFRIDVDQIPGLVDAVRMAAQSISEELASADV